MKAGLSILQTRAGTAARVVAAGLLIGVSGALAVACGSSTENNATGGATTGGAGGAGGGTISVGSGTIGCFPECVAPQKCSVANVCIDDGKCAADGDCGQGLQCDPATGTCVPGSACGSIEAKLENVPPNLLIVLDRSCSMTDAVGGSNKWKIAVAALNQLTTSYANQIRFGLTLFPDRVDPNCQQDQIPIPVGPGKEVEIQTLLTAALKAADKYFPDGPCVTNIDTAMQQAQTEPAFMDATRKSFALLLTDGQQSSGCSAGGGDNGTLKAITDLATAGVSTFVLGFGSGVDAAQMNKFAVAGGVPAMGGANKFYNAADQASLDAALATIAQQTLSCSYTLDTVPKDPTAIFVFFDNVTKIARDATHMDGWDYDAATNQVTFYGASCDSLKSGTVKDVDIVLGCDAPTPN